MSRYKRIGLVVVAAFLSTSTLGIVSARQDVGLSTEQEVSALQPANVVNPDENQPDTSQPVRKPNSASAAAIDQTFRNHEVLRTWAEKTAGIKLVALTYRRTEFDTAFHVERATTGRILIQTPHRWRMDEKAAIIKKGDRSKRVNPDGKPYSLEPGHSISWIVTEDKVILIDEEVKTMAKFEIRVEDRGTDRLRCHVADYFFLDAEETNRRFNVDQLKETDEAIVLRLTPKESRIFDWKTISFVPFAFDDCQRASILLDKAMTRPKAIFRKYYHATEVLYTFEDFVFKRRDNPTPDLQFNEPFFDESAYSSYKVHEYSN